MVVSKRPSLLHRETPGCPPDSEWGFPESRNSRRRIVAPFFEPWRAVPRRADCSSPPCLLCSPPPCFLSSRCHHLSTSNLARISPSRAARGLHRGCGAGGASVAAAGTRSRARCSSLPTQRSLGMSSSCLEVTIPSQFPRDGSISVCCYSSGSCVHRVDPRPWNQIVPGPTELPKLIVVVGV